MSKTKGRILVATLLWSAVALGVQMTVIHSLRDDVRTLSASNLSLQQAMNILHRSPFEVIP